MSKLWLDDERPAPDDNWTIVRSYNEFVDYLMVNDVPELISFDHDLGLGFSGYDCAMWIVNNDLEINEFKVHSANPVGAENIRALLDNWAKHCSERRYNDDD